MDGSQTILQISSSFSYFYDPAKPVGSRVDPAQMMLNGMPMDSAATYAVTINGFLAGGGDGFMNFTAGTNPVGAQGDDLDALIAYFGQNDPLTPPMLGRILTP
jgi:5'-nucleotidase